MAVNQKDRERMAQEVFIQLKEPRLLERDNFIDKRCSLFLARYPAPMALISTFETSKVIEKLKREHSFLSWI